MKHSSKRPLTIRIAGNTQNPALNTLREKGYKLWIQPENSEEKESEFIDWNAKKNGRCFSATDPVELLGLVAMWEFRGDDWQQKTGEADIADELISNAYPHENTSKGTS